MKSNKPSHGAARPEQTLISHIPAISAVVSHIVRNGIEGFSKEGTTEIREEVGRREAAVRASLHAVWLYVMMGSACSRMGENNPSRQDFETQLLAYHRTRCDAPFAEWFEKLCEYMREKPYASVLHTDDDLPHLGLFPLLALNERCQKNFLFIGAFSASFVATLQGYGPTIGKALDGPVEFLVEAIGLVDSNSEPASSESHSGANAASASDIRRNWMVLAFALSAAGLLMVTAAKWFR